MDDGRGWRALPPALLLGLGLTAVCIAMKPLDLVAAPSIVAFGLGVVADLLCAYGALEIADRYTGAARYGLRIAAGAWLVGLVIGLGWYAMSVPDIAGPCPCKLPSSEPIIALVTVGQGTSVITLACTIGLAIAAWKRHRVLTIAALVISFASQPPPFIARAIESAIDLGNREVAVLEGVVALLRLAMIAALAAVLAQRVVARSTVDVAVNLRRAAGALRLRALAMLALVGIAVTLPLGQGLAISIVRGSLAVVGVALNAVSFGWLGHALLGAARERDAELGPFPFAITATSSLWCGCVAFAVLPYVAGAPLEGWARAQPTEQATALVLIVPMVALAGLAVLAGAIAGFAARRGLDHLHHEAAAQLRGLLVLVGAAVVGEAWIAQQARPVAFALGLLVLATLVSLGAVVMMAQLCRAAAAAIETASGMPPVRMVQRTGYPAGT